MGAIMPEGMDDVEIYFQFILQSIVPNIGYTDAL